jgi:hypothetical protein
VQPAAGKTAREVLKHSPYVPTAARENRAFLGRVVRYLAAQAGVTQFLDIGTGLPTTNNVHEVAQRGDPSSRVAYVDNDRCKPGCVHVLPTPERHER